MAKHARIESSFRAALRWALLAFVFVVIGIYTLPVERGLGVVLILFGIFFVWQSYRTVKLFYPGAYLITGGFAIILAMPVLQQMFWRIVATAAFHTFGENSGLEKFAQEVLEIVRDLGGPTTRVSSADLLLGLIGLALCSLGVLVRRQSEAFASVSSGKEIENRIHRE